MSGFCHALDLITDYGAICSSNINDYPELLAHKPEYHYGSFWFTVIEKEGRTKAILSTILAIFGLIMPFCLEGSYNPTVQIIVGIWAFISSIFLWFWIKRQFNQMKKGISS